MAIYRGTGGSTSTTEQATIDAVNEDAATATTKAAEASASATAAASSASSASSSATSAASSASTATTKATEASTSATNAATSASAASSSASAASTSASNAASSATTAATDAATATTKAAAAASSATDAATSETNADTYADDAAKAAYGAVDTLQTLSDSSTLYSARHYQAKAAANQTASETAQTAAETAQSAAETAQAAAEAAEDAALAALDNFDDRYLGVKSSDPTLDNDGEALVAGALYYNDTDDVMKVYEGSQWVAAYASLSGALLTTNNLSDLNDAATARTNLGVAIGTDVQAYSSVLAGTTASYTTAEETKLAGIEASATADQTAQEIATAIDADATAEATLKSALGLGSAAYTASTDYATAAQGTLADSSIQPSDNISTLTNDSGYVTSSGTVTNASKSYVTTTGSNTYYSLTFSLSGLGTYASLAGDSGLSFNPYYNNLSVSGDVYCNDLFFTGNLDGSDNDQIRLGNGDDLLIYHNGNDSYIVDQGTGSLIIRGSNNIILDDSSGYDYLVCTDLGSGGQVELKYAANTKLTTTSSGIDVTGTAEMDTLSIGGTAVTATAVELNYVDGVTSNVQTQLDAKASTGKAIAMAIVFG